MLTSALGIPVGVWNAGNSLSATSCALSLYIASPVNAYSVKRPPTKRIFVSNTDNSALWNTVTLNKLVVCVDGYLNCAHYTIPIRFLDYVKNMA